MAETLVTIDSQDEIDNYLDRQYRIPVAISPLAPFPVKNHHYQALHALERAGFTFKLRELLHAIGCKVAALPSNAEDQCLRAAQLLLMTLDLRESHLCFRSDIASDFQTP